LTAEKKKKFVKIEIPLEELKILKKYNSEEEE